jgi:hypothetical protein
MKLHSMTTLSIFKVLANSVKMVYLATFQPRKKLPWKRTKNSLNIGRGCSNSRMKVLALMILGRQGTRVTVITRAY